MRGFSLRGYIVSALTITVIANPLPAQNSLTNEQLNANEERKDKGITIRSSFDEDKLRKELENQPLVDLKQDLQLGILPMETAVDPDSYIVGAGDHFMITIWSAMENSANAVVTPEGTLIIPTIGNVRVEGKKLSEVQKLVQKAGSEKYLDSRIDATLIRLRSVRVHVTGQVIIPGTYNAYAVHRVSDLIQQAGGLTSWAHERGIEIRHPDGTMDIFDLSRFKKQGVLDANLFVRGGDVIFVPTIDVSKATVRVEGMVSDAGVYQISPDENINDFLLRVDGFSRRTDIRNAYIVRSDSGNGTQNIPVFPYLDDNISNGTEVLVLQDGDLIMVPRRTEDVYVIGAVQYPGPHPYIPGLKVRDYLGFAGSMNQATPPGNARLIRRESENQEKGLDHLVKPGDTVFVPRQRESTIREAATVLATVANIIIAIAAITR
jgi:protein involved in polysaccharide export with SLBB domain